MKTISKLVATAALAVSAITGFAQQDQRNLGVSCGCPGLASRTTIDLLAAFPTTTANGIIEFTGDVHLTCDKIYLLSKKVYVPNGKTMTIDPGSLIEGVFNATPDSAACLIIERGGKIMADGKEECNIVFTSNLDPMDGSYSMTNVGKWGGIVICGTATNSVVSPQNDGGLGIAGKSGMGHCEGFNSANSGNLFGANAADPIFTAFNDNDNSGILRYVSVRHPGALVGGATAGNEINGISLYSVGRGTTIEHVEILASADDDIEYFGGTVNVKYISTYFGDDDKYDFDLGYGGKGQFYFSIAADSLNSGDLHTTDNGFECDADDQFAATAVSNHSYPVFYNCTMISNGHILASGDNTGGAAIQGKELTGGNWHNCLFANFRSGLHLAEARSTTLHKGDAYDQWTNDATDQYLVANGGIAQPKVLTAKNNVFIFNQTGGKRYAFTRGTLVAKNATDSYIKNPPQTIVPGIPTHADSVQFFTTDGNIALSSLAGIDYTWALNAANNAFTDPFHIIPSTTLTSTDLPPADGFFSVVNYKGAFDAGNLDNWLSGYGLVQLQSLAGTNPTDINQDGITDVNDFLLLLGKYGLKDK
jgi:hypothetical protein